MVVEYQHVCEIGCNQFVCVTLQVALAGLMPRRKCRVLWVDNKGGRFLRVTARGQPDKRCVDARM